MKKLEYVLTMRLTIEKMMDEVNNDKRLSRREKKKLLNKYKVLLKGVNNTLDEIYKDLLNKKRRDAEAQRRRAAFKVV